jgi:hypothetical protein
MIRLLADEDFNEHIRHGVLRRNPLVDFARVQDVGLSGAEDPAVLAWAARFGRIVVTHDASTMTRHCYQRVAAGEAIPGVFEVPQSLPIGQAINDLLLLAECSREGEWEGQVRYLPL